MKYCGCKSCELRGERNLAAEFELYYSTREIETKASFEGILKNVFSAQELHDSEMEFAGAHIVNVVNRINEYNLPEDSFNAYEYWRHNGGYIY